MICSPCAGAQKAQSMRRFLLLFRRMIELRDFNGYQK